MSQLIDVRCNISYVKSKDDEMIKKFDFIILTDKSEYEHTNSGEIVRKRGIDKHLITMCGDENINQFIKALELYRDADENELQ